MEFLGVGYQELVVIMLLLLVVVGPERMPAVAYQVGRAVRQMQRYARAVRDEFSDEIDYLEEQYKVVKGETEGLRSSFAATTSELDSQLRTALPSGGLTPLLGLPAAGESAPLLGFPPSDSPPSGPPSVNGATAPTSTAAPAAGGETRNFIF